MKITTVLIIVLAQCFDYVLPYSILAVIPFTGKSHYLCMQPILQELADRGHDLTVIAAYGEKNANYKQIVLERRLLWETMGVKQDLYALSEDNFERIQNFFWDGVYFTNELALNHALMQDFIKNDNSHFDLIFVEPLYQEVFYMFSYKYNAPMVGFCPMGYTQSIGKTMGNPLLLNYIQHEYLSFRSPMTFIQKMINTYSTLYDFVWRKYYMVPRQQELAEKHFNHLPQPLPDLIELEKNISLILLNTHFTTNTVRPYVPGIIEVGGAHIKKPKQLPECLQKYLDNAKDGAIYFSFGSNILSKDLPREKVDIFLKVFGKLKQKVLWKWEDDTLEGKPDNVFIQKWMPQNDILAHPNIKLFITHGGMLSTLEAATRGVPVIGIPIYADQHLNIEKVEFKGYGIKLPYAKISEKALEDAVRRILDNPEFGIKAKELADRFNDRLVPPMEKAIYWIEYVMKHNGANFMKSPELDISRYEYYILQLVAVFVILLFILILILRKLLNLVFVLFKRKKLDNKNGHLNGKKYK